MLWTERDGPLLGFVGEQYAISVGQLARLIGRRQRTGRWLRDRWRRAGWVESRPLTPGGGSFLWLTGTGIRSARSPYRCWRPNGSLIAHIEAVTEVRLLLERELRLGRWVCERELARRSASSRSEVRSHLPDGLLERAGERVAVEVELTLKSRARLGGIVEQLAHEHDRVWYFAAAPARRALEEIAAAVPWQNVSVYAYPPPAAALSL